MNKKYHVTITAPATQEWVYEIEAASEQEALEKADELLDDSDRPDPVTYEVIDDPYGSEEIASVEEVNP